MHSTGSVERAQQDWLVPPVSSNTELKRRLKRFNKDTIHRNRRWKQQWCGQGRTTGWLLVTHSASTRSRQGWQRSRVKSEQRITANEANGGRWKGHVTFMTARSTECQSSSSRMKEARVCWILRIIGVHASVIHSICRLHLMSKRARDWKSKSNGVTS